MGIRPNQLFFLFFPFHRCIREISGRPMTGLQNLKCDYCRHGLLLVKRRLLDLLITHLGTRSTSISAFPRELLPCLSSHCFLSDSQTAEKCFNFVLDIYLKNKHIVPFRIMSCLNTGFIRSRELVMPKNSTFSH